MLNNPNQENQFYSSSSYFLAGLHPLQLTIKLHSPPETYLNKWFDMDNRPKYFVDYRSRFIDTVTYNKLLDAGVRIFIFDITATEKDIQARLQHSGHVCDNSYITYTDIYDIHHEQVTVTPIDTSTTDSYTAVSQICNVLDVEPHWEAHYRNIQKIDNNIYGHDCPVFKMVLPPKILSRLLAYSKSVQYMKEEGTVFNKLLPKLRGVRVEGDLGCGIGYHHVGVDPLPLHPLTRHIKDYTKRITGADVNCIQMTPISPYSTINEGRSRIVSIRWHSDVGFYLDGGSDEATKDIVVSTLNVFESNSQGNWRLSFRKVKGSVKKSKWITFGNGDLYTQGKGNVFIGIRV